MKTKKWQECIVGVGLCMLSGIAPVAAAENPGQTPEDLRTEAVQLARKGDYKSSLTLLKALENKGYSEQGYWADYITILSWAGEDQRMIDLVQKEYAGDVSALPDYAAMPLARAYFRQGQPAEGERILALLSSRGNAEAKLTLAERCLYAGDYEKAEKLYQEIGAGNSLPEYRLHYSKACAAMERNDFVAAEREFALARKAAPKDPADIVRDMDAQRAALYIQHREPDRAAKILSPYVENRTATMNMVSDYLTALRFDNKNRQAIEAFKLYCPDWAKVPSYGLQNMADLYLRAEKYREADELYRYILAREDIAYVRMGHAYCLSMLRKETDAVGEYKTIVERYPSLQPAVAVDGTTMLKMGRIHLARQIYALLGADPQTKAAYRLQYARALSNLEPENDNPGLDFKQEEILAERTYYHEAQAILDELKDDKELGLQARSLMAENKVKKGLYHDADALLQKTADGSNAGLFPAQLANDMRNESFLHSYFEAGIDYKKDRSTEYGIDFQDYYGGNLYGITSLSRHILHDDENLSAYNQTRAGLSYYFDRGQLDLTYDNYDGDANNGGLRSTLSYEFNDVARLSFDTGKRPHESATAVSSGISERFHLLQWSQILSDKLRVNLGYNWNDLSDGNRYNAYTVEGSYRLKSTVSYRDTLLLTYARSHYDTESTVYDSPDQRLDYAAGFSRKWLVPRKNRTWESITMLSWGHDNSEPMEFAPSTRLELTQQLPGSQRFVLGAEYSWHQNRTDDTARRSGGYLFDLNYYLEW